MNWIVGVSWSHHFSFLPWINCKLDIPFKTSTINWCKLLHSEALLYPFALYINVQCAEWESVPLHGMQFGAPPWISSHRNNVLLGTSSSVQAMPSLSLLQQSSRLISDRKSIWQRPFFPCSYQQFPAGEKKNHEVKSLHVTTSRIDPIMENTHSSEQTMDLNQVLLIRLSREGSQSCAFKSQKEPQVPNCTVSCWPVHSWVLRRCCAFKWLSKDIKL